MSQGGDRDNFQDFQDLAKRETLAFAREHESEDTARLLLSAARYPAIDMPFAVQQIEGRRAAADKWPSLLRHDDYLYPPRLNREQSSSEATARYKAELLSALHPQPSSVVDLTGGMGIDTLAMASVVELVDYVERDETLCALMEHNLGVLGIGNVAVHHADSLDWLRSTCPASSSRLLYVDPARRDVHGRKVAAFEDCSPNILAEGDLLRSCCSRMMVKASPMIDIDLGARQLGDVTDIYVVAYCGECKEVLYLCGGVATEPRIHCVDLPTGTLLTFTRSEEAAVEPAYTAAVGRYLYEPCAALMKAGPFGLIGRQWGMPALAPNTHLYTADTFEPRPARVFEVLEEVRPSRKAVARAVASGRAHVVTRNYPIAAAALQRQLGLVEGGDLFLVATTVLSRPTAYLCRLAVTT